MLYMYDMIRIQILYWLRYVFTLLLLLPHLKETSVREAFEVCFAQAHPDTASLDPHKIDQKDQRRMSKCLQMAGWELVDRLKLGADYGNIQDNDGNKIGSWNIFLD